MDSVGAMAGAILGANLGVEAIPVAWRAIQAREYLQVLSARLAGLEAWRSEPCASMPSADAH